MKKFTSFRGRVIPLDRSNIDTDAIIPKQYLKSVNKTGFGTNLFDEWRYLDKGEPGMDDSNRRLNPDSIFNGACSILSDQKKYASMSRAINPFGDGKSSERIFGHICRKLRI